MPEAARGRHLVRTAKDVILPALIAVGSGRARRPDAGKINNASALQSLARDLPPRPEDVTPQPGHFRLGVRSSRSAGPSFPLQRVAVGAVRRAVVSTRDVPRCGSVALKDHPDLREVAGPGVLLANPEVEASHVAPHHLCIIIRIELQQQAPIRHIAALA